MEIFDLADDLGPAKVIHVTEPGCGLRGVLVVDNVAIGPSIGGLRMAPDVSTMECFRLARAMSMKNAAAGLPHGGGKSVMVGDPAMPREKKELLVRAMANSLRDIKEYVFGPDMGTNEECMAWVRDELGGRAVGLPTEIGGIPLDELGATGWGLLAATKAAVEDQGKSLKGLRFVVQGFGSVGKHAARFLAREGAVLVAAADSRGSIHNPDGLDVKALIEHKESGKSVVDFSSGKKIDTPALVAVDCDLWIPAARPDVLTDDNIKTLKASMVIPGANIPATPGAEKYMHENNILHIPDFIANAGGVICAAMEYHGSTEKVAFETITEKISNNTKEVLDRVKTQKVDTRKAAVDMATDRIRRAMDGRRFNII